MFVNIMRTNQRWLMAVISVLVIISFIWFYSDRTQYDRIVSDKVGKIYGRTLTHLEIERTIRQIRTAARLGLTNVVDRDLVSSPDDIDIAVNHLIVARQAAEMGILPSDDEVFEAEKKLPAFQGANGEYDSAKYTQFVSENLSPNGFSESQLEELVRRDLQFAKVRAIVDAPVVVSPVEARLAYDERYAKTNASVIRFQSSDFAAGIAEPTEDEIKKAFEDQKEQYIQPERRKVQYVKFGLTDEQKKLAGKEKVDALRPLGEQAVALLTDLLDKHDKAAYEAATAKTKLTIKETPDFELNQTTGLEEASIPGFAQAAFKLSAGDPDSDVPLETDDAFYDLHLAGTTPSRSLTLDEAKPKVVKALKEERARTALAAKAEEIRTKLADALTAGKSFADAAKDAGQAVQEVPAYSPAEPARATPDAATIAEAAQELSNGELSKFVTTDTGGLLVYVRNREGVDVAKFDQQKDMIVRSLLRQKAGFYFSEWLRTSREAAGVEIIPQHGGRG